MDISSYSSLVVTDSYGIDPLLDPRLNAVQRVTKSSSFIVSHAQAGRPDTISYLAYHTPDLWWAIMAFNGLTDIRQLTEGLVILIPDYRQIMLNLDQQTDQQFSEPTII